MNRGTSGLARKKTSLKVNYQYIIAKSMENRKPN